MNVIEREIVEETSKKVAGKFVDVMKSMQDDSDNLEEFDRSKKYILKGTDDQKKINQIVGIFCTLIVFVVFLFMYLSTDKGLGNFIFSLSVWGPFIILGILATFEYTKSVEINNGKIYKKFIFKRYIGTIDEITGFYYTIDTVVVEKNDKKFFEFNMYANNDSTTFNKWLIKNYEDNITIRGNKALKLVTYFLAIYILCIFIPLFISDLAHLLDGIYLILIPLFSFLMGYNEDRKLFRLTKDKIINRKLLSKKEIQVSNIDTVKIKKYEIDDAFKTVKYKIKGYKDNKLLFKNNETSDNDIDSVRKYFKKKNIKVIDE